MSMKPCPGLAAGLLLCVLANSVFGQFSIVQFTKAQYTVNENGGSIVLTVERVGEPERTAGVEFTTRDLSAIHGEDYVEQHGLLQFGLETNLTIVIPILNDGIAEWDESFSVILFNPDPFDTELGTQAVAYVTIVDNDRIQFTRSDFSVHESDGTVDITLVRGNDGTNVAATVSYWTVDGAAFAGSDYTAQSGELTFDIGENEKSISIPITDDAQPERDEGFSIQFFGADAALGYFQSSLVITIIDDDPGVEFDAGNYSVDEGVGMALITVRRTPGSTNAFSVDYATDDCNGATTAGADYIPQSGTLNFAVGETEKTFSVPIIDDGLAEGDETLQLILSNPVGISLGVNRNVVLRIRDNDALTAAGAYLQPQRVGTLSAPVGGASYIAVADNRAYVAIGEWQLQILDIGDPTNSRLLGSYSPYGSIMGIAVSGDYAFLSTCGYDCRTGWLEVIDISDPAHPRLSGRYSTTGVFGLAVSSGYAYLAAGTSGLEVVDVGDPTNPRPVGRYVDPSPPPYATAVAVAVDANVAFVCYTFGGLQVIDVSDPANPRRIGDYEHPAHRVAVSGSYVYLNWYGQLEVLDITDATSPKRVGGYTLPDWANNLTVAGGFAYLASWNGLTILDVTDPSDPHAAGHFESGQCVGVAISGNQAYVTGPFGMDVLNITTPGSPTSIGSYPTLSGSGSLAVSGNYALLTDGGAGLRVIDVSDPAHPRWIGRVPAPRLINAVAASCNHVFAAEYGGLGVFDISAPTNPRRLNQLGGGCARHSSIALEGDTAVLTVLPDAYCNGSSGLEIIDVSDPEHPQAVTRYSRDRVWTRSLILSGGIAYWAGFPLVMQIVDISDRANPHLVGEYLDPLVPTPESMARSGNLLFLAGYRMLSVVDISDPASPQYVGGYGPLQTGRLAASGERLYVAGQGGLEVIAIHDPSQPRHAAFYPTESAIVDLVVRGDMAFLAESTGLEIINLNPLGFSPGSVMRFPNGRLQFTLVNTRLGQSYRFQASTDLVHWDGLDTQTASDTKIIFTDMDARTHSQRFYRAVSP